MAATDRGEQFLQNLLAGQPNPVITAQHDDDGNGENDPVDDDASAFSSQTLDDSIAMDIGDDPCNTDANNASQNNPLQGIPPAEVALPAAMPNDGNVDATASTNGPESMPLLPPIPPEEEDPTKPKGRSLAHHHFKQNKVAFISFDVETGGEYRGILQLSAEFIRMELVPKVTEKGESTAGDTATNISRVGSTFNEYVNPGEGAIWSEKAVEIHGLHENHPSIKEAEKIDVVWNNFCQWVVSNVQRDEKIVLVAWNGSTCDLKWIWKLTQCPNHLFSLHPQIEYFMDPMKAIKHYTGCKLHPNHSGAASLELGCIWEKVKGMNLNEAHDSLVDVKAQTDILLDPRFVRYINKKETIKPIQLMFSAQQQRDMKRDMEPNRPVHQPWVEISLDEDITWSPRGNDVYTGSEGGGFARPSSSMTQLARTTNSITKLSPTTAVSTKKKAAIIGHVGRKTTSAKSLCSRANPAKKWTCESNALLSLCVSYFLWAVLASPAVFAEQHFGCEGKLIRKLFPLANSTIFPIPTFSDTDCYVHFLDFLGLRNFPANELLQIKLAKGLLDCHQSRYNDEIQQTSRAKLRKTSTMVEQYFSGNYTLIRHKLLEEVIDRKQNEERRRKEYKNTRDKQDTTIKGLRTVVIVMAVNILLQYPMRRTGLSFGVKKPAVYFGCLLFHGFALFGFLVCAYGLLAGGSHVGTTSKKEFALAILSCVSLMFPNMVAFLYASQVMQSEEVILKEIRKVGDDVNELSDEDSVVTEINSQ